MVLRLKSACAVVWNLNGEKSGPKTGLKLSIAVIDAEKMNEAHHLSAL
jgi:hypothetical protein